MARNKVDLPEPEGPETKVVVPASSVSRRAQTISRPSGRDNMRSRNTRSRAECRQTFDDSLVRRQRLIACDKERERGFDPAKGAGRLRHLSKGDLPEEKVWRDDDIGDHHVGLKIGRRKRQELQGAADDGIKVRHD